jgi:DNA helicase-2/ATP-dependent DNA helicase PcrA
MGLGVSYRSAPNVLKLLNVVSVQMGGQALVAFDSDVWHEGGIAVGAAFDSGKSEATFVEQTARLILEKQPGSTIGVITRMGWRRTPIDEVFGGSDLPSTRWDLAVDNPQIINLITDAAATLGNDVELEQLKNEVLRKVDATDPDTRADVADAFSQIAELMENAGSVAAALSQLRIMESGDSVVGAGVHLLNAHVGKGQQFDWVFIPGFEDGHLPSFLAKSQSALDEELRILLVMISRARHGVILSRSSSLTSKKGNSYSTKPSRWAQIVRPALGPSVESLRAHINSLSEPAN